VTDNVNGTRGWFDKIAAGTARVLAIVPPLLLAIVLLHAVHVRVLLGRWPVVYRDSPNSFLLKVHEYGLFVPTFFGTIFGTPVWAVLVAVLLVRRSTPLNDVLRQALLIGVGIGGLLLFNALDPTGYVEWFLD
jgi:hypothetical protein